MSKHLQLPTLLILGNGMATGRLLDELARHAPQYQIIVVGDEPQGSYNRIMLSPVLAGELERTAIIQKSPQWFRDKGISFLHDRALAINTEQQQVVCEKHGLVPYDKLVIATGSRPSRIPAANQSLEGIVYFRTLADISVMEQRMSTANTALVIGGGLLGLEAAHGLLQKGLSVTLLHRGKWLMNRQLNEKAGNLLQARMQARGLNIILGNQAVSFNASVLHPEQLASVTLADGNTVASDLVVIATGITPNAELGLQAGLKGNKAVAVNDFMQTSNPNILALGECVEYENNTFGLVDPIWDQARILAEFLCGTHKIGFSNKPVATRLKVSGIDLFSMGEIEDAPALRSVELLDQQTFTYRKLVFKEKQLVGAVLLGDVRGGMDYYQLMLANTACAEQLPMLLFAQA